MNLKQLSQLLGLSQTTVSRALNGYPEVNAETRQRVLDAVRETGYRPNRAAQRLATGRAGSIGLDGTELQPAINEDKALLAKLEAIRAAGALRMGLIDDVSKAAARPLTPKIAFVAPSKDYVSSSGKHIAASAIDLNARAISMGKLHHAMMGTASVAIAVAAAVPGTVVNAAAGGGTRAMVRFGHPSGTLRVGAEVARADGQWIATKAVMSRSARVLMDGAVRVPADAF